MKLPFGAEKAELPQDETDESEKEEQTEPVRSNTGIVLLRLSLISDHSFVGVRTGEPKLAYARGPGVFGGVTKRWKAGIGVSRPLNDGVGCIVGLDTSDTASDISMVGIAVSDIATVSVSSNTGIVARLRLTLKACGRGGGGGL